MFSALAFFGILRPVMAQLPMTFSGYIDANIATHRIESFLAREELPHKSVDPKLETGAVVIQPGVVNWGHGDAQVTLPEIKIRPGEFVVILGPVGGGKTSFLHSLMNELEGSEKLIRSNGRIAYVPQLPWILNGSVRDNITFGSTENELFYRNSIAACSLEEDLSKLAKYLPALIQYADSPQSTGTMKAFVKYLRSQSQ